MSHGGVIYKATVLYKNKEKIYIGPTGWQFKSRFYKHTQSFRSEVKKESTRDLSIELKIKIFIGKKLLNRR